MTNQAENLIQAIKLLPAVHEERAGLNVPHLVVDWSVLLLTFRLLSRFLSRIAVIAVGIESFGG